MEYKTVVRTVGILPDEIRGKFEYRDGKVEGSLEINVAKMVNRAKAYETLALFSKVGEDKMFTDFGIEPRRA